MKIKNRILNNLAFGLIIVLSVFATGCSKKNKNQKEPIEVKVLESSKERPAQNRPQKEEVLDFEEDIIEDVNQNENISNYKDIEIDTENVTTYTYFSLKEFPEKLSRIVELDSYQDWLEIKTTYPEVFSLINQELLTIEENYFTHSKGFLVLNKDFEENKFLTTKKIIKQGDKLDITFSQEKEISTISNYKEIVEAVSNFEEKIKETAVIYFFNRTDIEDVTKGNVNIHKYEKEEIEETEEIEELSNEDSSLEEGFTSNKEDN